MTFLCIECGKKLDESNFYRKMKNKCKDCLNKKLKCELCAKFFFYKKTVDYSYRTRICWLHQQHTL